MAGITHEQAQASVFALSRELYTANGHVPSVESVLKAEFDVYESVGWDGEGTVLFTGYYAPIIQASRVQTSKFRYPLYKRPPDLVSDRSTGKVLGQRVGDQITPYPTRRVIETTGMLGGHELVWLSGKFEAYIVQLQGSARIRLTDGTEMVVGYAASNGRDYTSVAMQLVADGKLDKNRLTQSSVRDYFVQHPDQVNRYLHRNDRYVFFAQYDPTNWPAGSLGFAVTPMRSLATDKSVFPRGGVTLVATQMPGKGGATRPFRHFMLDQDTGGAIRAAGRADLYMGVGPLAKRYAGRQYAEGRLYYLILKPQAVDRWLQKMKAWPSNIVASGSR